MLSSASYRKTKELILYISTRLSTKGNFGATLLNKALYFIDNISYLKTGLPVSEFKYVKQTHGPTTEPSLFLIIKQQMEDAGELEIVESDYFGRIQKRYLAKRNPDVSQFSVDEIVVIDDVLSKIGDLNSSEASEISHQFPAWKTAADRVFA